MWYLLFHWMKLSLSRPFVFVRPQQDLAILTLWTTKIKANLEKKKKSFSILFERNRQRGLDNYNI